MNAIEAILNAGNRILEEPCVYQRRSGDGEIVFQASIESRDVVEYTESLAGQSFRFTVFSCDARHFAESDGLRERISSDGGLFRAPVRGPERGDTFSYRGVFYKVVEFEGVTWKPRFDPFDGRIIFFAERV